VLLFGIGTKALVWGFLCQGVGQGGEASNFFENLNRPLLPPEIDESYVRNYMKL
jgi:hypothetical protein